MGRLIIESFMRTRGGNETTMRGRCALVFQ